MANRRVRKRTPQPDPRVGGTVETSAPAAARASAPVSNRAVARALRRVGDEPGRPVPSEVIDALGRGPGHPLPPGVRASMGPDAEDVRVHTDTAAAESARHLGARAYTVGSDVAFAPGEYRPESSSGRGLLEHEVAHVVTQRAGGPSLQLAEAGATDTLEGSFDAVAITVTLRTVEHDGVPLTTFAWGPDRQPPGGLTDTEREVVWKVVQEAWGAVVHESPDLAIAAQHAGADVAVPASLDLDALHRVEALPVLVGEVAESMRSRLRELAPARGDPAAASADPEALKRAIRDAAASIQNYRENVTAFRQDLARGIIPWAVAGVSATMGGAGWEPPDIEIFDRADWWVELARQYLRDGETGPAKSAVDGAVAMIQVGQDHWNHWIEQADMGASLTEKYVLAPLVVAGAIAVTYLTAGVATEIAPGAFAAGAEGTTVAGVTIEGGGTAGGLLVAGLAVGSVGALIGGTYAALKSYLSELQLAIDDPEYTPNWDRAFRDTVKGAIGGAIDGLMAAVTLPVNAVVEASAGKSLGKLLRLEALAQGGLGFVDGVLRALLVEGKRDPAEIVTTGAISAGLAAALAPVMRLITRKLTSGVKEQVDREAFFQGEPPAAGSASKFSDEARQALGIRTDDLLTEGWDRVVGRLLRDGDPEAQLLEKARSDISDALESAYNAKRTGAVGPGSDLDINFREPGAYGRIQRAKEFLRTIFPGASDDQIAKALKLTMFPESRGLLVAESPRLSAQARAALKAKRPLIYRDAKVWLESSAPREPAARAALRDRMERDISDRWQLFEGTAPGTDQERLAQEIYETTVRKNMLLPDAYHDPGAFKVWVVWRDNLSGAEALTVEEAIGGIRNLQEEAEKALGAAGLTEADIARFGAALADGDEAARRQIVERMGKVISAAKQVDRAFRMAEALGLRVNDDALAEVAAAMARKGFETETGQQLARTAAPQTVRRFHDVVMPELERVFLYLEGALETLPKDTELVEALERLHLALVVHGTEEIAKRLEHEEGPEAELIGE